MLTTWLEPFFGDRDMQIPSSFQLDQFSSTEIIGTVKILSEMLAFKSTSGSFSECIDGQDLSVIDEAVISVTNQISLWTPEEHGFPEPRNNRLFQGAI